MIHSVVAGGVVVNARGEILVTSQGGLSWSLPKGHVDEGEDLVVAARREIYEETGVDGGALELVRPLGSYERHRTSLSGGDDPAELKTIHLFLFHVVGSAVPVLCPVDSDHPEARWVAVADVATLLTHRKDKEFFEGIIRAI